MLTVILITLGYFLIPAIIHWISFIIMHNIYVKDALYNDESKYRKYNGQIKYDKIIKNAQYRIVNGKEDDDKILFLVLYYLVWPSIFIAYLIFAITLLGYKLIVSFNKLILFNSTIKKIESIQHRKQENEFHSQIGKLLAEGYTRDDDEVKYYLEKIDKLQTTKLLL